MTTFDPKKALTEIIEGLQQTVQSTNSILINAQENLSKYEKVQNDVLRIQAWIKNDLAEKQAMLRALIQKEKEDMNNG